MKRFVIIFVIVQLLLISRSFSQEPRKYNSAEIQLKLQKLKVLGNVLYVAAHPDDENTGLITYMANEIKVNTAYFSCTRGDGGQNLIGPEIQDELGVIRTQELLAARRVDHGEQFFSRAVDFGYSKHPEETFTIWDKEKVLGDLVWVIRKFKPDIIITRFNPVPGTTHGHHTASSILANEAFEIAGDETKYQEQLLYVTPWSPKSLYWNTAPWYRDPYQKEESALISVNIGEYNTLLGMSYSEISALSRSNHKSQGFGATGSRGERLEYLQYEKGEKAGDNIFDVVDISWNRIEGCEDIDQQIDHIIKAFDPTSPAGILVGLLELRERINNIPDEYWKEKKIDEIDEIIYAITGLYLEIKATDYTACPGQEINLEIEAINRSDANIKLKQVRYSSLGIGSTYNVELKDNEVQAFKASISIPQNVPYSQPYWLVNEHGLGMFEVPDQQLRGLAVNGPAISTEFILDIDGTEISFTKPVIYKKNDPVRGEVYRPFVIAPPVYVNISGSVMIFTNHANQEVTVEVRAGLDELSGELKLELPDTWKIEPAAYVVQLATKGEIGAYQFKVTPPGKAEIAVAKAIVEIDGKRYNHSFTEINYDHIPAQLLFNKAEVKFVKLGLNKGNEKIGYIMGAGDNIPDNLQQIGYNVTMINDLDFNEQTLDRFNVIILGIRALNTVDRLKFDMANLMGFVQRGGTLIVQYNTNFRMVTDHFSPYPIQLSRERITVEEAPVKILNADHQVMNYPNKIGQDDFKDWVQERGLYFPSSWSDEFTPILSSHDPDEQPLDGGLLIAQYGEGYYVYTGYSWFRELPAGVPGAYRIFVNMLSLGNSKH